MPQRTKLKRLPERGSHDRRTIDSILDEALYCHVGFVHDGYPVVIPTIHAREGDTLFIHGSPASRMLRDLKEGMEICVNATILDGLVFARSLFNHSMNYRSVVVFGRAREVTGRSEKLAAMKAVSDHIAPGRWDDARGPNDREFNGTTLLAIDIDEASAKVRTGPPGDEPADIGLGYWAGVVPVSQSYGPPMPAPDLADGIGVPPYLSQYGR
jgi:nitroimidazol reductase NimA-like FMN-containing flavoprotein (pyridoxamine 5'-phosphate oxidase superfamily)